MKRVKFLVIQYPYSCSARVNKFLLFFIIAFSMNCRKLKLN